MRRGDSPESLSEIDAHTGTNSRGRDYNAEPVKASPRLRNGTLEGTSLREPDLRGHLLGAIPSSPGVPTRPLRREGGLSAPPACSRQSGRLTLLSSDADQRTALPVSTVHRRQVLRAAGGEPGDVLEWAAAQTRLYSTGAQSSDTVTHPRDKASLRKNQSKKADYQFGFGSRLHAPRRSINPQVRRGRRRHRIV